MKLRELLATVDDVVQFEVWVFSNLTHEHLNFHLDMEDYFTAKALHCKHNLETVFCLSEEVTKNTNFWEPKKSLLTTENTHEKP